MVMPPRDTEALTTELNDLLYAIGHDLRAPVRAITGFMHLLKEQLAAPADQLNRAESLRFLGQIDTASQRLQHMIDGLLGLSTLSQHRPQPQSVPLRPLCESLLSALPAHTATIAWDMATDAHVQADPALLRAALAALLDNAIKFSRDALQPVVHIGSRREGSLQVLSVTDNGVGFDMQYVARLGVPFQTLHARADLHGLGLGLATVRCATRLQGGQWSAQGQPGQGSCFSLRWPA